MCLDPSKHRTLGMRLRTLQNTSRFCRALHGRRAFARRDSERLRHTADGSFVLPAANPGVRIEPDFVAEEEQAQLVAACQEYAARYGYAHDGDTRSLALGADGAVEQSGDLVNNVRVTGRLERPDLPQRLPPWGYGEVFQENALPPPFQQLAARVKQLAPLGLLRDVTINGRQNGFFQLDPHLDPQADGPDVFIMSLLSTVVLTFTPSLEELVVRGLDRRTLPHEVGLRSWSDADVDALVQPGTLLHFSGRARDSWMHAIRAGVQVPTAEGDIVCDWWGSTDYLLRRNDTRFSIVLAFGEREPEGPA